MAESYKNYGKKTKTSIMEEYIDNFSSFNVRIGT